jgi:small subunit ribosomal protein S15Ae
MVRTSVLHDALNNINNAEKAGKRQVLIRPSSKVIIKFLQVMQRHGMSPSKPRHVDGHISDQINAACVRVFVCVCVCMLLGFCSA